jgi:hypothetical protein
MEELVIEEEDGASSALQITLGDVLIFINWMNQTEKSLDRAEALPSLPDLESGKVKGWIQLVQRLEERFRRSDLPPVVRPPFKFVHADTLTGAKVRGSGAGGRYPSARCGRGVWY